MLDAVPITSIKSLKDKLFLSLDHCESSENKCRTMSVIFTFYRAVYSLLHPVHSPWAVEIQAIHMWE